jgi:erythrocyte band 7 integral membrane protein
MFSVVQVIASEGELKASRALKEAADVIQESPSALQVLYLYKGTVTQDKFNLF